MNAPAAVRADQRFTNGRRCIVCGGAERDPRGKGRRCHGFLSADGEWAHCSRDEHAGVLVATDGNTYAHRLGGQCKCGLVHSTRESDWDGIVAAYDYRDERGTLLFQVVRKEPKAFVQRRPNGDGTWDWKTAGTRRILYRLPELITAPRGETIFVVEGEKDVDTLRARGLFATTSSMGARKFGLVAEHARTALRGRHVAVIADADEDGRAHAAQVAEALRGYVATLRLLELPRKDATEWFDAGGSVDELKQIVEGVEAENFDIEPPDPFQEAIEKAFVDVQNALGTTLATKRLPLFALDGVDLLQREFQATSWLVHGLITRGGITTIGAEPKAAKTWLGTEIALAVATGTPVCGEFFAEQGIVAYFYAEDLERQIRNRERALLAGADRTLRRGTYRPCPRGMFLDVTRDEDLAWIVASCRELGKIDLLVLDPLRDISSAAEDKSDEMSPVMRRLRLLGDLLACTVAIVHYSGKSSADTAKRRPGGQRLRGSSAIHGSTDSGIYLGELEGDGAKVFRNVVDSEVKGARSRGRFVLELQIEDDENKEAIRATWTVSDPEPKTSARAKASDEKRAQDRADDDRVFSWVCDLARTGERLTRTALRKLETRPLPEKRVTASLDRMIETNRLALCDGTVGLPQLTDLRGDT